MADDAGVERRESNGDTPLRRRLRRESSKRLSSYPDASPQGLQGEGSVAESDSRPGTAVSSRSRPGTAGTLETESGHATPSRQSFKNSSPRRWEIRLANFLQALSERNAQRRKQRTTPQEDYALFMEVMIFAFGSAEDAEMKLNWGGRGTINYEDLEGTLEVYGVTADALQSVGMNYTLRQIFDIIDDGGVGEINLHELCFEDPFSHPQRDDDEPVARVKKKKKGPFKYTAAKEREVVDDRTDSMKLRDLLADKFGDAKSLRSFAGNAGGKLTKATFKQTLQVYKISQEVLEAAGITTNLDELLDSMEVDEKGGFDIEKIFAGAAKRAKKKKAGGGDKEKPVVAPEFDPSTPEGCLNTIRRELIFMFGSAEAAWEFIDLNHDGYLSFGEFDACLKNFDIHVCHHANKIFRTVDKNGVGRVDLQKFFWDKDTKDSKKHASSDRSDRRLTTADSKAMRRTNQKYFGEIDESAPNDSGIVDSERKTACLTAIGAFADSKDDKSLKLLWGHLGREGADLIAAAIVKPKKKRKVESMQLCGNFLGCEGLGCVVKALDLYCDYLRKLNLSWNSIGDRGAESLAASGFVPHLKDLILSHNRIRDVGAECLARVCTKKPQALEKLDLEGNYIGRFGCMELRYIEKCHKKLKVILVGNNVNGKLDHLEETRYLPQAPLKSDDQHWTICWAGDTFCPAPFSQTHPFRLPVAWKPGAPTASLTHSDEAEMTMFTSTSSPRSQHSYAGTELSKGFDETRQDSEDGNVGKMGKKLLSRTGPIAKREKLWVAPGPTWSHDHSLPWLAGQQEQPLLVPGQVGDSWPLGVALSRSLNLAKLAGEGPKKSWARTR